jgi:hypothetical protein
MLGSGFRVDQSRLKARSYLRLRDLTQARYTPLPLDENS